MDETDSGNESADADEGPVQVWLVERQYDDGGMVTLVYATPEGDRRYRTQFSAAYLDGRSVTAGREESAEDLEPVADEDRERYREEARRVRERHDPDEEI